MEHALSTKKTFYFLLFFNGPFYQRYQFLYKQKIIDISVKLAAPAKTHNQDPLFFFFFKKNTNMINSARRPLATFLSKRTSALASTRTAAKATATATASFGWFGLGLRFNGTSAATQPVEEQVKELIASNKVFVFSKT
jgi:hypothetical protein